MSLDKLIDRLWPTSTKDYVVIAIVIIVFLVLWPYLKELAFIILGGLYFQNSNEVYSKAKDKEEVYKQQAKKHLDNAEQAGKEADESEFAITEIDNKEFIDDGESNEDIVNRIRKSGL